MKGFQPITNFPFIKLPMATLKKSRVSVNNPSSYIPPKPRKKTSKHKTVIGPSRLLPTIHKFPFSICSVPANDGFTNKPANYRPYRCHESAQRLDYMPRLVDSPRNERIYFFLFPRHASTSQGKVSERSVSGCDFNCSRGVSCICDDEKITRAGIFKSKRREDTAGRQRAEVEIKIRTARRV